MLRRTRDDWVEVRSKPKIELEGAGAKAGAPHAQTADAGALNSPAKGKHGAFSLAFLFLPPFIPAFRSIARDISIPRPVIRYTAQ